MKPDHIPDDEIKRIKESVDWATWLAVKQGDYP